MKTRIILLTITCAAVMLALSASSASADMLWTANATAIGNNGIAPWEQYTFGTNFTVGDENISVTKLAYTDYAGDGLGGSHQVGLWDTSGTLLASVTIGSSDTDLYNLFSWKILDTPVTLLANTQYVLGADTSTGTGDQFNYGHVNAGNWGAEIAGYNHRSQSGAGAGFVYPAGDAVPGEAWVNSNMEYVPEPATMALLGFGSLGMLIKRKRR